MDLTFSIPVGAVDTTWTDYHAMDSDDSQATSVTASTSSTRSTLVSDISIRSMMPTTQSPISAAIDIPFSMGTKGPVPHTTTGSLSSAPALDYSTSPSSGTMENTSPSSFAESGHTLMRNNAESTVFDSTDNSAQMQWEETTTEQLAIPKLEPADEDNFRIEDVQVVPAETDSATAKDAQAGPRPTSASKPKRPRGRPRKFSTTPTAPAPVKTTRGRSKTGCITCRKRKKKCDEARPRCMNCEKNAVVCEGYPEKLIWKSGKEKAEEGLLKNQSLPVITMQPIFSGMETTEDRIFWKHYNDHLSAIFTVEGEHRNAFKDMLVPLATRHPGMMHSILSLANKHLDFGTPYGAKILQRNTKVTMESLRQRGAIHNSEAYKTLFATIRDEGKKDELDPKSALESRYGQMLCLVLESIAEGDTKASRNSHYPAFTYLIANNPPRDPTFYSFVVEIFYYHILADDLLYLPRPGHDRLVKEEWTPAQPIYPPRLIGLADGLFSYLYQISSIRHCIRTRIKYNADPRVDYDSLYRASDIEGKIQEWSPDWPSGDSREVVTLLYKQMAWLYLKTTICPPESVAVPALRTASYAAVQQSTESCVSSPSPTLEAMSSYQEGPLNPRRHSIAVTNATLGARQLTPCESDDGHAHAHAHAHSHAQAQVQASRNDPRASPPPIRRPANHEPRITLVVEEALRLLESFKPSDPAQTLLLVPCVVIGTACYAPSEQERIRAAIRVANGYTGLRNTEKAVEILNEVWKLMEQGEYLRAWDWQAVADRLEIFNLF